MSYLDTSFSFKIKKIFRYLSLFGFSRTFVKVVGQVYFEGDRHSWMLSVYKFFLAIKLKKGGPKVAFIGCGNFAFTTLAYYSKKMGADCVANLDMDAGRARRFAQVYGGRVAEGMDELLSSKPDLVFIASNHSTHTRYAIECLECGIPVHIEKPVSISEAEARDLYESMSRPDAVVYSGYNRPISPLFTKLLEKCESESGPVTINWFIAGHEIDEDHWYFAPAEGGRVLGNLCHWLDLSVSLVEPSKVFPVSIYSPTTEWLGSDFIVNLEFGDKSVAALTFSAKGHAFEGVRERLNLHKGDLLAYLSDFQSLEVDVGPIKERLRLKARDHGHESNVANSIKLDARTSESKEQILLTSLLAVGVNNVIKENRPVMITEDYKFLAVRADHGLVDQ